jgi:hypothetical protein
VNASSAGRVSTTSVGSMPARWLWVTVRTALPQASRVVSPSSAARRISAGTSSSSTKWHLEVLAGREVGEPAAVGVGDVGHRIEVAGSSCPPGTFTRIMWVSDWRMP